MPIRSVSSRFADFLLAFRPDSVDSVDSTHRDRCRSQGANTKKAQFLNRGIGLSDRKASRALNLPLAPLSNNRASARSVRLGLARRSCRFGRVASRFGRFGRVDLECCLCRSCRSCRSCRFGVLLVSRFGVLVVPIVPIRSCRVAIRSIRSSRIASKPEARTQKKAQFLNRGIGLSYRKASRALNLRLAPLSNNRASARSVRLGLARRSCIVMPTSDHRRIGRYI